ncbi:MAG: hypothetical protein R3C59_27425 [Planctomycetaceae bacterium]
MDLMDGMVAGGRKMWRMAARREYVERLSAMADKMCITRCALVDIMCRQFFADIDAGRPLTLTEVEPVTEGPGVDVDDDV